MNQTELAFLSRSPHEHHQIVLAHVPDRDLSGSTTLNQVSFRVDSLDDLKTYFHQLTVLNLPGMEPRNHGNSWSFYFFDPEGNKVEIYCPTNWQVKQPWRIPLDLAASTQDIISQTDREVKKLPGSLPLDEWQKQMTLRLGQ